MSFSSDTKEELSKLNNLGNVEIIKAELTGYNLSSNTVENGEKICFFTENANTYERYKKVLINLNINYNTEKKGKLFYPEYIKNDYKINDIDIENKDVLISILRGSFMASGTINNPNKKYHLEILLKTNENAKFLNYITEKFNIKSKTLKREKNYSIYLKDGENISNFLALIGAIKSVLRFEEIRVVREIKNNINRIVNCETANLNKIISVAVNQIEDIKYIINKKKFEDLPISLQEIATIRIENPYISLEQMGKLLNKPIGKSGVNHRLKKISQIAEDLRKEESN